MGKTVIHLKPYCKGCKKLSVVTNNFYADNQVVSSYSGCEHAKKCAQIHKYIKEHPYTTFKNMFANCKPLTDIQPVECGLKRESLTPEQKTSLTNADRLERDIRKWFSDEFDEYTFGYTPFQMLDRLRYKFEKIRTIGALCILSTIALLIYTVITIICYWL